MSQEVSYMLYDMMLWYVGCSGGVVRGYEGGGGNENLYCDTSWSGLAYGSWVGDIRQHERKYTSKVDWCMTNRWAALGNW